MKMTDCIKKTTDYIEKKRLLTYAIALIISLILLVVYFLPFAENTSCEKWCTLSMSVGASGIGAVLLTFFIDYANGKREYLAKKQHRSELLSGVLYSLNWLIDRSFWAYNRIQIEFLGKGNNGNCYKLQCEKFLDNLDVFADEVDRNLNPSLDEDNFIHNILGCVRPSVDRFRNSIVRLLDYYQSEKNELFTTDELNVLRSTIPVLEDCDNDAVLIYSIKEALDKNFRNISEFSFINNLTLYYSDKKVCFQSFHEDKISDEIKQNAVEW